MFTFYSVTRLLFEKIGEVLTAIFSTSSTVVGAVALVFSIVIIINLFNNKINKKFFVNNKGFIFVTLLLEIVSCLISSNETLIKFNFFVVAVSLIIILYKVTSPAKKVIKKEGIKNEKSI